jgi:hypothetical protein
MKLLCARKRRMCSCLTQLILNHILDWSSEQKTNKVNGRGLVMAKKIRVRSKRLDQVDETKLSLALWLLAKDMVENRTTPRKPRQSGEESL